VKKIVSIVLNNFQNDSRVLKTNISLQNGGYDVKVVALFEDGIKEFEIVQNIQVHRVKLVSKNWSKNKFVQLIKYFEFIYRVVKQYKDSDILHCNDLNALPIGVIIKKFFNKDIKIVYDAHEHESYRVGFSNTMQRITQWLERNLIKYADKVITVSDSIANDYEKMYGIEKPALVLNTPFYQEVKKQNIFREEYNIPKENIIFLYQGGLSPQRGILEFAEIVKNMKNISYVVMGYGVLENKIRKLENESNNIFFHPAVSSDILLNYTSSADIGICIEENICRSWDYALPNKMFEYFMAGLPVFVGGLSEMKNFVKNHNVGFIIDDLNNIIKMKETIKEIMEDYTSKFQEVDNLTKKFNWEEQEKVLLQLYKEIS
jgi:glycosyltransferase involved in cell wall biosynthesis